MRELFLTFDVEDFINERSTQVLPRILELLQANELKALFFLTGHATKKLSSFPSILKLLRNHELGYHSTSHSVRPTIFEYTDVQSYEEAVQIALLRETSNVDSFTGEVKGKGGIALLNELFPNKLIISFRAPGFCWSPAVSEALGKLGVIFDFSTDLADDPILYKGITFYPRAFVVCPPEGHSFNLMYRYLLRSFLKKPVTTLLIHPQSIVNITVWDSFFFSGDPSKFAPAMKRSQREQSHLLWKFSTFFKQIAALQKVGVIKVTPPLHQSDNILEPTKRLVQHAYLKSVIWPIRFFKYHPRFLYSHYLKFFDL